MVETPILFITFVRPEYAQKAWDQIKAAQPKTLYFYSNKGRAEKEGELERNEEIRLYIKEIDWECDLHTFFRDECVNVYDSIRGAINWLFEKEERGIILEEDCVPTKAFFSFVDQAIIKFQEEKNVWYISGDNFYNLNPSGYDYVFSRYHWMYGWATWQNRWNKIKWGDFEPNVLLYENCYTQLYKTRKQYIARKKQILNTKDMVLQTNCWDYAFGYIIDANLGFGVFPKTHLVHNIGYSGEHHEKSDVSFVNIEPLIMSDKYEIKNEYPKIEVDKDYDYVYYQTRWKNKNIKEKIYSLLSFYLSAKFLNRLRKFINCLS